jgi:hypothetical protein
LSVGGERSPVPSRAAADLLAGLALLVLPWLLYGGALELWWTQDDFFQLRFTARHGPAGYLLDPEVWRQLPNRVLSPLLFASYDLDLALAGLDPAAFYGHQLLSLGLAALALYVLLRLWLPAPWALLGGGVFLLGPAVASLAPLLMVRHYPEALALALVSAVAFVAAARRRGGPARVGAGLSALLYLAASLAKEIAVPLPALLVLLPAGTLRRRLRLLAPHAAVLVLYVLYRAWMLGTLVGGYGWAVRPGEWPGLALRLPGKLARELAGPGPWGWVVLAALAAAVLLLARRSRRAAALAGTGLFAALLPVLPVATDVAPRFAVTAWLLLAGALPPAARHLATERRGADGERRARRLGVAVALALLLAAALAANRQSWDRHLGEAARMSVENRGFLELGAGELLRHPLGPPASMVELRRFARELLGSPATGDWFYDDLFLCARKAPMRALWAFDPAAGRLEEITGELPALSRGHCGSIRWEAPLEVSLRREEGVLAWELGPYRDDRDGGTGGYAFLLQEGRIRYPMPARGAFRVGGLALRGLRVRYESPQGWVTYSPPLDLEGPGGPAVRWARP